MLRLVVLAALAAAALASDVVELTGDNFDEVVNNNEFVLVEFFAPWCGHCKKLAPEFEKAAAQLKGDGVVLATVDATEQKALASKFGVRGYPTLHFFKNGESMSYDGGRTEDTIVSWVRKKSGPPAKALGDAAAVEAFSGSAKVTIVAFVAEGSDELKTVEEIAAADDERSFGYCTDAAVAEANGASVPGIVLFKKFDEGKNVFEGAFDAATIKDFINTNSVPLVVPFTMDEVATIFQSPLGQVAFLFTKDDIPAYTELATKYRGKFVFATSDGGVDRLNQHVGVEVADFPVFTLLSLGTEERPSMLKYPMAGDVDADSMSAHIDAYLAGSLKPHYKSEDIPADNSGPVTVIVGKNFEDIVLDTTKDVLLEVYAPWCGHCKNLAPIYDELGEAYASNDNIVIAKMDGTANEIEGLSFRGFPTLKFYPAGPKTAAGEDYKGGRALDDFKDFLSKNAKNAAGHDEL